MSGDLGSHSGFIAGGERADYLECAFHGAEFGAGDTFGEVESTKSVSEVYAPVQGVVVEVNGDLEVSPELVNGDPYGAGWLIVVEPVDLRSVETLLDADAYRKLTEA